MNLASLLQENPNLHAISECFAIAGPDRAAYSEEAQSRLHLLPAADNALVGIALGMAMDGSSVVVELASAQSLWSIIAQLGEENHKAFARPIAIRVPITPMDTIPWSALESLDCDVWCPRSQEQRHNVIQQALTAQRPTIVLEPQTIRKQKGGSELSASERITEGEDISLFAWGDSVATARLIAAQMTLFRSCQ